MTIQFVNGMMVEVTGGTWLVLKKLVRVRNAEGDVEIEAPLKSVMLITRADLQSAQARQQEDQKKLEAISAFNKMLGDPNDSQAVAADMQG